MRSTTEDRYRISIAIQSDKLLVHVDGPEGPTLRQHLREVRRAATQCGLEVVERGDQSIHPEERSQPNIAIR